MLRIVLIAFIVFVSRLTYAENLPLQNFSIPGQDLGNALMEYALQSGYTVVVSAELVEGFRSVPIVGRMPADKALHLLLSSSPFTYEISESNQSITLERQEHPPKLMAEEDTKIEVESSELETVIVTGIKASLINSMNIKRFNDSIVDAVSEEDLGKFPDSNLAESLQRVAGVTLTYSNNEGDKINVRGFDPNFNKVLLNGRQIPSSDQHSNQVAGTRAFNFSDFASENISSLTVYKTNESVRPSGGIGSVIDIQTPVPLELNAREFRFGVKAVNDTSIENETVLTPDIFSLVSYKNTNESFGVLGSFSYQVRESHAESASMDWQKRPELIFSSGITPPSWVDDLTFWYPKDLAFTADDYERERINGQFVMQFSPLDSLALTFDYHFSQMDVFQEQARIGTQFSYQLSEDALSINELLVLENDTVVFASESGNDYTFVKGEYNTRNKNNSFGGRLIYVPTDAVQIKLDAHHSVSERVPLGRGSSVEIEIPSKDGIGQQIDTRFTIPQIRFLFSDPENNSNSLASPALESFVDQRRATARWRTSKSSVDEVDVNITWEPSSRGVEAIILGTNLARYKSDVGDGEIVYIDPFQGTGQSLDFYDTSVFFFEDGTDILDQFSGGFDPGFYYYNIDVDAFSLETSDHILRENPQFANFGSDYLRANWAKLQGPKYNPSTSNILEENTLSGYFQILAQWESMMLQPRLVAGARYEAIKVETVSEFFAPASVRWVQADLFAQNLTEQRFKNIDDDTSSAVLPNVALSFNFTENIIGRLAYSESMTRPRLDLLSAQQTLTSAPLLSRRTAQQGTAALAPYFSKNVDTSIEFYYDDDSYLSLARFDKKVENFPRYESQSMNLYGITDVYNGPRAEQVRMELEENGIEVNDSNVFNRMLELYPPSEGEEGIAGNASDPLMFWDVSVPISDGDVDIGGYEFTWQHLFGESGFGSVINITDIKSTADFDLNISGFENLAPPTRTFANVVGFFDKGGWQVRVAMHWNEAYPTLRRTQSGVLPIITDDYLQADVLLSYQLSRNATFLIEGLNVTNENQLEYNISKQRLSSANQFGRRYQAGFSLKF